MTGNRSRRRALVASLGLIAASSLAVSVAQAQTAPPLATLFNQTKDAPRVEMLEAEVQRAEGLLRQAGTRPNPSIGAMTENVYGERPYQRFGRAETTLQVNLPIELGAKRSARVAAGTAGVAAAQARRRDGHLTYAYDLALAYAGAEVSDRRIEIAQGEVDAATNTVKAVRALVDAGREPRIRRVQAEAELNSLQGELELARANRISAYARLSALSGVEQPFTALSEPLLARLVAKPTAGPVDPLQTPAYLVARAERDAAEKRVTVERRKAVPDVTVQVGARRLEVDKANALIAGITVPLNLFDANRGNIAASQAELRGANARMVQARLEAESDMRAAFALLDAADAQAKAAENTLASAEEGYRLAHIAYEAGKTSLLDLLTAQHSLGAARGVVVDAAAARLRARAELARLNGQTLTGDIIP
ncbi:MAG: TolC family protein [Pseudomonadota bacterium]